jgi:hypothetical protein
MIKQRGTVLSKGRLIVVLAFALVLASTQCAALCIVGPCTDTGTEPAGETPCHHQHEAPDNQTPAPCPVWSKNSICLNPIVVTG